MHQRNESNTKLATAFLMVSFAFTAASAGAVFETRDPAGPAAATPPAGIGGVGPEAIRVKRIAADEPAPGSESQRVPGVSVRISAAAMAGAVSAFALTPDGQTAVYVADQDTAGLYELYSVPVDGSSAPVKISAGLGFVAGDSGVAYFQIAPGGTHVVLLADAGSGGSGYDAYSAPVAGGASPVRLNTAAQGPVAAVGAAPDGTSVAFFGPATAAGGGSAEVYRATIGVADSGVQLSDASAGNASGEVVAAEFSPDGARLIYAADESSDDVFQWHSVALAAAGPGADVQLSSALGFVSLGRVTPDGATFVYTADENLLGVQELFSVPIAGGGVAQLNPSMAGSGVIAFSIAPNGQRLAYLADQVTSGVIEVFGAETTIADSGVRLNTPLAGTQSADVVTMAPDNMTVLYEADENLAGTLELMAAPADAAATPSTLDGLNPPQNAGFFSGLGTPVVGRRAIYPVVAGFTNLFSVRYDGTAPRNRINDQLGAGETVLNAFVPSSATRMMAYGIGSAAETTILFAGPIRSDLAPEQVNATAAAGSLGVLAYEIASDESHAVYLQDQDTAGKPELYSRELDSDHDGVGNASDNCPYRSNSGQGLARFNQTILASDAQTFTWPTAQDVRYVRGPLASVSTLAFDDSGAMFEADSFTDASVPASGAGFYYLFALDCDGRSYQTGPGAEPSRDSAGFP